MSHKMTDFVVIEEEPLPTQNEWVAEKSEDNPVVPEVDRTEVEPK